MDAGPVGLARYGGRLNEIVMVLRRHGFGEWARLAAATPGVGVRPPSADCHPDRRALGPRLRAVAVELGPTFVRFGRMMSRRPDVVGTEVASELETLPRWFPPDAPGVVHRIVTDELGAPLEESFASFSADPLASGAIAQVHAATLHGGTEVVVTVLHDGVERRVKEDLELMGAIARYAERADPEIARFRPSELVSEFEQDMRRGLDLENERARLQRLRASLGNQPDVAVPIPFPEFSTSRVLTVTRPVADLFEH
jgi:ubiquinone biosynthesis protein